MILFYAAAAFLAGVALAAIGGADAWPVVALGGAGVSIGTLLAGRRPEGIAIAALALLVLFGIDRYEGSLPPLQPGGMAVFNDADEAVTLRGIIVDEPQERETGQRFTLEVEAVQLEQGWAEMDGRAIVTARAFPAYEYGDTLRLTAELQTPPVFETFDYRDYLARRGVVSQVLYPRNVEVISRGGGNALTRLFIDARRPLGEALERSLPEPESALALGILLGQRASIPDALSDDLNRAGISHLVAISGQNVAIVAGVLVAGLAWWMGRRPATAVAIALIWVYAVFVGGSPSVLRAALMATMMLGAVLAGRPGSALGAVTLAAAVLVAWHPLIVDDVAFQLSFAATLGIILASKRIQDALRPRLTRLPDWLAGFLAENLAITTAASLVVLPVIAGSFGRLSLVSLPANLLAAPVFVLALGGSLATAVAGAVSDHLGLLVGELAYLPLTYLVRLGQLAADLPVASVEVSGFGLAESLVAYAALGLGWLLLRRSPSPEVELPGVRRFSPALAVLPLVIVAASLVWYAALQPDSGSLRVTILDVGQGDALLIETPAGHRILVDGGPSGARIAQALGRSLPASERRIDLVVLTHAQDDHVTGLVEVLRRYEVSAALAGPLSGKTAAYDAWLEELERSDVPLSLASAGQQIDLGDGVRIEALSPPREPLLGTEDDLNNNSVVLRLVYGEVSFLLTGDLEAEGEAALLDTSAELHATVLKVGHHGSDGSTTPAFLDAVDPSIAVLSVGDENTFGHPSPTTRLRLAGVPLLRTDQNGDVRFETDGKSLWVDFVRGDYSLVPVGVAE
jgi:competence protein ComEC